FPYADPRTHSFQVRVELPEAETGLQPGMTVKTTFKLGEQRRVMVPVSALVRRSEVTAVYVVGEDNRVSLRQVRRGHQGEDRAEVIAGLEIGRASCRERLAALAHLTGEGSDG